MHKKERAIAPPFLRHLQIKVSATTDFDTDQLGTFTGEIPRKATASETAIQKAKCGSQLMGTRFGLGSEGGFIPHPQIPFLLYDQEVLAFYDRDKDLSIVEFLGTHRTNYGYLDFKEQDEILEFLNSIRFPSHGIVLSQVKEEKTHTLAKGVQDLSTLRNIISKSLPVKNGVHLRVSTDMRAHMNPTRMGVIRALASKLARRIACLCPQCQTPGFGEKSVERGIPCSWCHAPTRLVRAVRTQCIPCGHFELEATKNSGQKADPCYCPNCNP